MNAIAGRSIEIFEDKLDTIDIVLTANFRLEASNFPVDLLARL